MENNRAADELDLMIGDLEMDAPVEEAAPTTCVRMYCVLL